MLLDDRPHCGQSTPGLSVLNSGPSTEITFESAAAVLILGGVSDTLALLFGAPRLDVGVVEFGLCAPVGLARSVGLELE